MSSARSLYRAHLALAALGVATTAAAVLAAGRTLSPVDVSASDLVAACERIGLTSVSVAGFAIAGLGAVVTATAARGLQALVRNLRERGVRRSALGRAMATPRTSPRRAVTRPGPVAASGTGA